MVQSFSTGARFAAVCVVVAVAGGGCARESPPDGPARQSPAGPTLVVAEDHRPGSAMMEAIVIGTLGENQAGCLTLDDRVLVTPAESRLHAEPEGQWRVEIPPLGTFGRGEELRGVGGELEPRRDTLRKDWLACLPPGGEPWFVVVNPVPAPPEK